MGRSVCCLLALAAIVVSTAACAATFNFEASLDGLQETPPNTSPATGHGTFVYDDVANTIASDITFSGLLALATAAHIHGPAAPGEAAAVVVSFTSGFPNATSGTYTSTLAYPVDFADDLKAGLMYVSIHDAEFPGGEIRGQILPEPSSLAVLGVGVAGVLGARRRKRD